MKHVEMLVIKQDKENGYLVLLKPKKPYLFTPTLVSEISDFQDCIINQYLSKSLDDMLYILWCFQPGCITLKGLDFEYIYDKFKDGKLNDIDAYISKMFDVLFRNYIGFGLPVINISLVERPSVGFAREFFLMNQVNFISNRIVDPTKLIEKTHIQPLNFKSSFGRLYFPKRLYKKNKFYKYQHRDLDAMKMRISNFDFQYQNATIQNGTKATFDEKKGEMLEKIFRMGSDDIDSIKRLSIWQKREHNRHSNS